jgi:hypothetical protein
MEVSVRGFFIRVNGLARLFYLFACFCFPVEEVGVTGAVVSKNASGVKVLMQ